MKKLAVIFVMVAAMAMVSCKGNAAKQAAATETEEVTTKTENCEGCEENCTEEAAEGTECAEEGCEGEATETEETAENA